MAVTRNDQKQGNDITFKGVSTDTKPTDCAVNSLFVELDTGKTYYFDGTSWNESSYVGLFIAL